MGPAEAAPGEVDLSLAHFAEGQCPFVGRAPAPTGGAIFENGRPL